MNAAVEITPELYGENLMPGKTTKVCFVCTGNTCDCFLEHFSWICFDFLREDARFLALQNRMREYAEEANRNN